MKRIYLCLLTVCSMIVNAQTRTNLVEVGFSGASPPPITRTPEPTLLRRASGRIEERADSELVHRLTLDLYLGDREVDPQEWFAKRGQSLFKDGGQYALREWGLQTPVYRWFDEKFERVGGWYASFWRDTLSGNVERYNAQSPADFRFLAERERFSGLRSGIRVFSLKNPYVFWSYAFRDDTRTLWMENTLRLYMRGWDEPRISFITEVPVHTWSFGVGVDFRDGGDRWRDVERNGRIFTDVDRAFDVTLGLKGRLCGGFLHIGGDILSKRVVAVARWSF